MVTALVTAGARSNTHRAGTDMGTNLESAETVNILLLLNAQLTDDAQATAVIMATEGQDGCVSRSERSQHLHSQRSGHRHRRRIFIHGLMASQSRPAQYTTAFALVCHDGAGCSR